MQEKLKQKESRHWLGNVADDQMNRRVALRRRNLQRYIAISREIGMGENAMHQELGRVMVYRAEWNGGEGVGDGVGDV